MKRFVPGMLLSLLVTGTAAAGSPSRPATSPPPPPVPTRVFAGGGLALSFGDVDYVGLSPFLGWHVNRHVDLGFGLQYAYRNDSRYARDYTTNDYGGSIFTRLYVADGVFAGATYEYLRYEFYDPTGTRASDDFSSVFIGGGLVQPMGGAAAFVVSAMYNLSWSNGDPGPYDSPWVVGAGVSVGF